VGRARISHPQVYRNLLEFQPSRAHIHKKETLNKVACKGSLREEKPDKDDVICKRKSGEKSK